MKNKIQLRIIGNHDLIPKHVFKAFKKTIDLTRDNKAMTMNVCFAYNSEYEVE